MEDQIPTQQSQHSAKSWKLITAIVLAVLFAAATIGVYFWQTNRAEKQKSSYGQQIDTLASQVASLQKESGKVNDSENPATYTEKMPNGKTISYPLTEENTSIIWWYGGRDDETSEPNGTYIYVSSVEAIRFVSEINNTYLNEVCGKNAYLLGLEDLNKWAITTDTKDVSKGNAATCLDLLADSRFDEVGRYRERAQQILANEQQAVKDFAASIRIQ